MIQPAANTRRNRFPATVLANRMLCREHWLLTVRVDAAAEFPATRPGQFIQIAGAPVELVDEEPEIEWGPETQTPWPTLGQMDLVDEMAFLRKPFSLAGHRKTKLGDELEIIHRVVGLGTRWLSQLQPGQGLDLLGPLGNEFALSEGKSIGLMVGGGVGLPPMFYLAQALAAAKWRAVGFVGAQTRDMLALTFTHVEPTREGVPALSVREWADCGYPAVVCTDDGSLGLHGLITAGLKKYLEGQTAQERAQTVIYTCGPDAMMRAVASLAHQFDVECQACLEQAMACGMGTCQSCVVKIFDENSPHDRLPDGRGWRYHLACTHGPVFDSRRVVW